MTATPQRLEDIEVFDLTGPNVVQLHGPSTPTPNAVLGNPDALKELGERVKKKPGRKKGSKNRPKKSAKAKTTPTEQPTVPETPRTTTNMLAAGGDAGPRMWWTRINSDGWFIILAVSAALALGGVIAFAVVR
jgi:hypothetical protein